VSPPSRSRVFWPAIAVGVAFGAVGAVVAFGAPPDDGRPLGILAVVAGAVAVHDVLVAPVAQRIESGVSRRWRPGVAGPVRGALAVSAVIALVALPLVGGFGRRPTNSSALPLPYDRSLVLLLAGVWLVAGVVIVLRRAKHR
jgi:hypothetical protein